MNELTNLSAGNSLTPFRGTANWLRHEIDRLFDNVDQPARNVFGLGIRDLAPTLAPTLALDMTEDDKAYHLAVELPGLDEKDVELTVADGVLSLAGEKKEAHEGKSNGYLVSERRYGKFMRKLTLPQDVDPAKIKAVFRRGVMEISMAKDTAAAPRTHKIAISSAKD